MDSKSCQSLFIALRIVGVRSRYLADGAGARCNIRRSCGVRRATTLMWVDTPPEWSSRTRPGDAACSIHINKSVVDNPDHLKRISAAHGFFHELGGSDHGARILPRSYSRQLNGHAGLTCTSPSGRTCARKHRNQRCDMP